MGSCLSELYRVIWKVSVIISMRRCFSCLEMPVQLWTLGDKPLEEWVLIGYHPWAPMFRRRPIWVRVSSRLWESELCVTRFKTTSASLSSSLISTSSLGSACFISGKMMMRRCRQGSNFWGYMKEVFLVKLVINVWRILSLVEIDVHYHCVCPVSSSIWQHLSFITDYFRGLLLVVTVTTVTTTSAAVTLGGRFDLCILCWTKGILRKRKGKLYSKMVYVLREVLLFN